MNRHPVHRLTRRRDPEPAPLSARAGLPLGPARAPHAGASASASRGSVTLKDALISVEAPATPLDRCPDCGRPATDRRCAECGRAIDGRPSTLADRTARHLRHLGDLGVSTRGHGSHCITRETGGWAPPAHDPGNLRQTCPCCGRDEYRGSFCSGCGIPTGAGDWHRPLMTARQAAALAKGSKRFASPRENGLIRGDEPETEYLSTQPEQLSFDASDVSSAVSASASPTGALSGADTAPSPLA